MWTLIVNARDTAQLAKPGFLRQTLHTGINNLYEWGCFIVYYLISFGSNLFSLFFLLVQTRTVAQQRYSSSCCRSRPLSGRQVLVLQNKGVTFAAWMTSSNGRLLKFNLLLIPYCLWFNIWYILFSNQKLPLWLLSHILRVKKGAFYISTTLWSQNLTIILYAWPEAFVSNTSTYKC